MTDEVKRVLILVEGLVDRIVRIAGLTHKQQVEIVDLTKRIEELEKK